MADILWRMDLVPPKLLPRCLLIFPAASTPHSRQRFATEVQCGRRLVRDKGHSWGLAALFPQPTHHHEFLRPLGEGIAMIHPLSRNAHVSILTVQVRLHHEPDSRSDQQQLSGCHLSGQKAPCMFQDINGHPAATGSNSHTNFWSRNSNKVQCDLGLL